MGIIGLSFMYLVVRPKIGSKQTLLSASKKAVSYLKLFEDSRMDKDLHYEKKKLRGERYFLVESIKSDYVQIC